MKRRIAIYFCFCLLFAGCDKNIPEVENHADNDLPTKDTYEVAIDFTQFIGKNVVEAIDIFGKNFENGLSEYNYEWLIYNYDDDKYIQIGHVESKIVTVFILGENLMQGNFNIGDTYKEIAEKIDLEKSVVIHNETGEYRFELTEDDLKQRPLVQLTNDVYAQLYFDRILQTLVAVRLLDGETLLKHRPYQLHYRGDIEKYTINNRALQEEIDQSNEKQIYYVTNVIRNRYGKTKLSWNKEVAKVAFQHSKDMKVNQYFDHISPSQGDLDKRLKKENIAFSLAGENIAAGYPDGIDAVIGWLNSKEHRDTMFHDQFSQIGIGVYDKYYTQNFITE